MNKPSRPSPADVSIDLMDDYLQRMGRIRLLRGEDEVTVARQMEAGGPPVRRRASSSSAPTSGSSSRSPVSTRGAACRSPTSCRKETSA